MGSPKSTVPCLRTCTSIRAPSIGVDRWLIHEDVKCQHQGLLGGRNWRVRLSTRCVELKARVHTETWWRVCLPCSRGEGMERRGRGGPAFDSISFLFFFFCKKKKCLGLQSLSLAAFWKSVMCTMEGAPDWELEKSGGARSDVTFHGNAVLAASTCSVFLDSGLHC